MQLYQGEQVFNDADAFGNNGSSGRKKRGSSPFHWRELVSESEREGGGSRIGCMAAFPFIPLQQRPFAREGKREGATEYIFLFEHLA